MKVGLIGLGVVGTAQARMFDRYVHVTYDPKYNDRYPQEELKACDFAVIAVPTPSREDGSANIDYVFEAFNRLPSKLPVVIRSTVPPGTTNQLMRFREAHVTFVPEFLQEREEGEWRNSTDVPFLILGAPPQARSYFWPLLQKVFPGNIHGCSAIEAEIIKYAANLYGAARVTFVNEMAQICKLYGVRWEEVRQGWLKDPRMTPQYTEYDGFEPGWGGPCWPKDIAALIAASREKGYEPEFLQAIQDSNERFRS